MPSGWTLLACATASSEVIASTMRQPGNALFRACCAKNRLSASSSRIRNFSSFFTASNYGQPTPHRCRSPRDRFRNSREVVFPRSGKDACWPDTCVADENLRNRRGENHPSPLRGSFKSNGRGVLRRRHARDVLAHEPSQIPLISNLPIRRCWQLVAAQCFSPRMILPKTSRFLLRSAG